MGRTPYYASERFLWGNGGGWLRVAGRDQVRIGSVIARFNKTQFVLSSNPRVLD